MKCEDLSVLIDASKSRNASKKENFTRAFVNEFDNQC